MISAQAINPFAPRRAAPARLQDRAEQTAAALPPLLVAAERVAATVAQGVHGRRRVGQGETFWQFRQYEPGDAATRSAATSSGGSAAAVCSARSCNRAGAARRGANGLMA